MENNLSGSHLGTTGSRILFGIPKFRNDWRGQKTLESATTAQLSEAMLAQYTNPAQYKANENHTGRYPHYRPSQFSST